MLILRVFLHIVLFLLLALSAVSLARPTSAQQAPKVTAAVILEVFFADGDGEPELATGFFLDHDGLMATADHVFRGSSSLPGEDYNPSAARDVKKLLVHTAVQDVPIEIVTSDLDVRVRYGAPKTGGRGLDLAVVRVPLTDRLRSLIEPLDLAQDTPSKGQGYWSIGPGCTAKRPGTASKHQVDSSCFRFRTEPATITSDTSGVNRYDVTAQIAQGFSGGPLLSGDGLVVGITSWGETLPFTTAVSKSQYTAARLVDLYLSDIRKLPRSDIFRDESTACKLIDSVSMVTVITLRELLATWPSTATGLTAGQCKCCCVALSKFRHVPPSHELARLNCQPTQGCTELSFYHAVGQSKSLGSGLALVDEAFAELTELHQKLLWGNTERDLLKMATADKAYGEAVANLVLNTGPSSWSSSYRAASGAASGAALAALRTSAGIRETPEKYTTIAKILAKEGAVDGASAAQRIATLLTSGRPGDPATAHRELDRAISNAATLQSVRTSSGFGGPKIFGVKSTVAVSHGDYVFETDPRCPESYRDLTKVTDFFREMAGDKAFQDYVGPIVDLAGNYVPPALNSVQGGTLAELFSPVRFAQCRAVGRAHS